MSKYCPIVNRKVLYLECNECENKVCRQQKDAKQNEKAEKHIKKG